MEPMLLSRVRRTIQERRLLRPGQGVVAAVSGGPDSVAMLDVLARLAPELGLSLHVASVDHGLRPAAADELALAGQHAARLGLPFHRLALGLTGGASVQARARAARYAALRELATSVGARRIATAHTRDDQAETVLGRLLRGAGPRGLSGIAPRRADGVVRPLLDVGRAEVRAWLEAHALPFAADPSNDDPRFERARIRNALLPALRAESPALVEHLARLADDARGLGTLVARRAERLLARAAAGGASEVEILARAPRPVRREALRLWAERAGGAKIGRAHLDALDRVLEGKGTALLPGGLVASTLDGQLRLAPTGREEA